MVVNLSTNLVYQQINNIYSYIFLFQIYQVHRLAKFCENNFVHIAEYNEQKIDR